MIEMLPEDAMWMVLGRFDHALLSDRLSMFSLACTCRDMRRVCTEFATRSKSEGSLEVRGINYIIPLPEPEGVLSEIPSECVCFIDKETCNDCVSLDDRKIPALDAQLWRCDLERQLRCLCIHRNNEPPVSRLRLFGIDLNVSILLPRQTRLCDTPFPIRNALEDGVLADGIYFDVLAPAPHSVCYFPEDDFVTIQHVPLPGIHEDFDEPSWSWEIMPFWVQNTCGHGPPLHSMHKFVKGPDGERPRPWIATKIRPLKLPSRAFSGIPIIIHYHISQHPVSEEMCMWAEAQDFLLTTSSDADENAEPSAEPNAEPNAEPEPALLDLMRLQRDADACLGLF